MSYKLAGVVWNDDGTMKQELTPLQALENIKWCWDCDISKVEEDFNIVETALKEGDKQLKTLKSMYGNLEKLLVKANTEKEKYKKAVEIIKHIMNSCYFYYVEEKDTWEIVFNGEILLSGKGKEEYKLLKEVLK